MLLFIRQIPLTRLLLPSLNNLKKLQFLRRLHTNRIPICEEKVADRERVTAFGCPDLEDFFVFAEDVGFCGGCMIPPTKYHNLRKIHSIMPLDTAEIDQSSW